MEDYEVEQSELETETNPISDMISDIENKNYTSASEIFNDLLNDRLTDAIDAKKAAVASEIFNDAEETEQEEDLEEFLEDEEV